MAAEVFGSTLFIPKIKSLIAAGTTKEELTEDIIVQLNDARVAAVADVGGVFINGLITIPGPAVIDGVALNLLDRVLLWDQTNDNENGVYRVLENVGPTVLFRSVDFKPNIRSSKIQVLEGDTLACTLWHHVKNAFIVLNVSPIKFFRVSAGPGPIGVGDVVGVPPSVIDNIVIFDNTTSTLIKDSGVSINDILAALNQIVCVDLIGTAYTTILNEVEGAFFISVKNTIANGPAATFSITKNIPGNLPSIVTITSTPGAGSGEILELQWLANGPLELRKDGVNYDGQYCATIFGNGALPGGDVTDATNIGGFAEVFAQKIGTILQFRTLQAGAGINITQNLNDILIEATGGGVAGRIAFQTASVEIIPNTVVPVFVPAGYFAWDQSEYSLYTVGRITFNAEIGDQEATVRLQDETGAVTLGSLTTAGSGVYTFNVGLPVVDSRLSVQTAHDGLGVVLPNIFGLTLSYQQGGGGGSGQIAFQLVSIEIDVLSAILDPIAYFAWDQSNYSGYSNGSLTFEAEIAGKTLDIQLREVGGAIITAIPTIVASGFYTFPLTSIPVVDRRLVLEVKNNGAGVNPLLFGATLRFDQ